MFSLDSDEIIALINLLHKTPELDAGLQRGWGFLGNRNRVIYVITNYYFSLDIYALGNPVRHGP
jgi:hypothetical protein